MRHQIIGVLLEEERIKLGEDVGPFSQRIYPDVQPHTAKLQYMQVVDGKHDFPERRLNEAAAVLGVPAETLFMI